MKKLFHSLPFLFTRREASSVPFVLGKASLQLMIRYYASMQTLSDVQGQQIRLLPNGSMSRRGRVDHSAKKAILRRRHCSVHGWMCGRGFRPLAFLEHCLSRLEAGESYAGYSWILETSELNNSRNKLKNLSVRWIQLGVILYVIF